MSFDDMNRAFVIAAYTVMWVVVGGYLVRLIVKGSRVRADYDRMRRENTGDNR